MKWQDDPTIVGVALAHAACRAIRLGPTQELIAAGFRVIDEIDAERGWEDQHPLDAKGGLRRVPTLYRPVTTCRTSVSSRPSAARRTGRWSGR